MPQRRLSGLIHLSEIETHDRSRLPVRVSSMTQQHADYWDEHVQSRIWKSQENRPRADAGWRWPLIYYLTRLGNKNRGFVVGIEARDIFQPCVMLLAVEGYPSPIAGQDSVFVWWLSPAPTDYFTDHLGYEEKRAPGVSHLMAVGMDVAITHSYNCRWLGLVWLHADPGGGQALMDWYSNPAKGGMSLLPKDEQLPTLVRRRLGNDGRYFYHDEETALRASMRMDTYRRVR